MELRQAAVFPLSHVVSPSYSRPCARFDSQLKKGYSTSSKMHAVCAFIFLSCNKKQSRSAFVSCSLSFCPTGILAGRGARMRATNPKRERGGSLRSQPPSPFRFFSRALFSSFPFPRFRNLYARSSFFRGSAGEGCTERLFTPLPAGGSPPDRLTSQCIRRQPAGPCR